MAITPLMPVYPRSPVRPVRGEGVYLYGEQGEKYLDFAAGIAVNLLGHGHPHLTKAIQEQAATLMHVSNLYGIPQGEALAQRLVDLTFADTVFFTNSGVEAVECAIKTARRYHHAKGNPHKHDADHLHQRLPRPDDGDDQRDRPGQDASTASRRCCRASRSSSSTISKPRWRRSTRTPPASWSSRSRARAASARLSRSSSQGLREACDEHDLMLVFDEVQCGVARTGTLYAYEHYGIDARHHGDRPRASAAASRSAPAWRPRRPRAGMVIGTHGSTYGGNPLAMAAGQAVLDVVANDEFLAHVAHDGRAAALGARADDPQPRPSVRQRARHGPDARHQDEDRQPRVRRTICATHGLLTVAAGDNVVRVLPPLIIDDSHIARVRRQACRRPPRITTCPKRHDAAALPQPVATPAATRSRRCSTRRWTARSARAGWPKGKADADRAARRRTSGDDLREELDPHPRQLRHRHAPARRHRRGARQRHRRSSAAARRSPTRRACCRVWPMRS